MFLFFPEEAKAAETVALDAERPAIPQEETQEQESVRTAAEAVQVQHRTHAARIFKPSRFEYSNPSHFSVGTTWV